MKTVLFQFKAFSAFLVLLLLASCSNDADTATELPDPIEESGEKGNEEENEETPLDTDNDGVPDSEDDDVDGDGLIEIYSVDALNEMRNSLANSGKSYRGVAKNDIIGFELTQDLDFENPEHYDDPTLLQAYTTGKGWVPIGNRNPDDFNDQSQFYNAVFDGNDFTITNLYINNTEDFRSSGLFGVVGSGSIIRNLALVNVSINTESFNVGGLSGFSEGKIENCHVKGEVRGRNGVGLLIGSSHEVEITKCSSYGEVIGIDIPVSQSSGVGGLLGTLFLGNSNANPMTLSANIKDCFSQVNVNGSRTVGGLIGAVVVDAVQGTTSVSIRNCYAIGLVTGSMGTGGLIATSDSSVDIQFCYWDIETSGVAALGNSINGEGLSTTELQTPTSNTGIYATWDPAVWDFGTSTQYPVLRNMPNGIEVQR